MRSRAAVAEAVQALYATFDGPAPRAVTGCPCCSDGAHLASLSARPRRQLDGAALGPYAFSALYTVGTMADFKHFLPRILELVAADTLDCDTQVVFHKLVYAGPWTAAELAAVSRFAEVALAAAVDDPRRSPLVLIESVGLAGLPLATMLDRLLVGADATRVSGLARLVFDYGARLTAAGPGWIWWKQGATSTRRDWLLAGPPLVVLRRAVEGDVDHPDAGAWASACDVLECVSG